MNRYLPLIVAALLLVAGCAVQHRILSEIPDKPSGRVDTAHLEQVVAAYAPDSDERRAARFLIDNLPLTDAITMAPDDLRENVDYALLARHTLPWGQAVPWDIFQHYVLPHRTSQEPFRPYRAAFYRELAPLCATAPDMGEALRRIGSWCARQAAYRPTSRRDLGVLSIIEGGYGRCEETNILFMAAARAVCLPVRQATVPWWQHADGNHAWVEAWTPEGWHFLESGTEFTSLDSTWFATQRPRMAKVVAYAFGHPDDPGAYRTGPGFALVDSTSNYTRSSVASVTVTNGTRPLPQHDVFFSVPSLGGLRPVTKAVTNEHGQANATLGPGTFFVSCAADAGLAWAMLDTREAIHPVTFDAAQATDLPPELTFCYPGPLPGEASTQVSDALQRQREARDARWLPLLHTLPAELQPRIALAGERIPRWLRLLHGPESTTPWLHDYVLTMDDKDLLQAEPELVPTEVLLAGQARARCQTAGFIYTDEIFRAHVLAPRLYQEPWSPWRRELQTTLVPLQDLPLSRQIEAVRQLTNNLPLLPPALFGPEPTPGQMLASGACTRKTDRLVLALAILRGLGIPARLQADFNMLEYYDGAAWHDWSPQANAAPSGGTVRIVQNLARPLLDFGVARIEGGIVRTLDDLDWNADNGTLAAALQAGAYVLLVPTREPTATTVRLRLFTITPNRDTLLHLQSRP